MTTFSYHENTKVQPVLTVADIVATATNTSYIDVGDAAGPIELGFFFGSIASTDSTGEVVLTIEASTAGSSNATEVQVAGHYRISGAVNTDSMGALTSFVAATGVPVINTDDNKIVSVFIDPAKLAAAGADYQFIRAVITPTAEITATIVGAYVRFPARYAGASIPSST
jgi:hypothetical protein